MTECQVYPYNFSMAGKIKTQEKCRNCKALEGPAVKRQQEEKPTGKVLKFKRVKG